MNIFLARSHNLRLAVKKKIIRKHKGGNKKQDYPYGQRAALNFFSVFVICLCLRPAPALLLMVKGKKKCIQGKSVIITLN